MWNFTFLIYLAVFNSDLARFPLLEELYLDDNNLTSGADIAALAKLLKLVLA